MLQLGGTHGRTVTCAMTNFQTVSRVGNGKKGVVQQKSCKEKAHPTVWSEGDHSSATMKRALHPELLRTIVGVPVPVKRLPGSSSGGGGEGTGARGATGPRGRTLREDDLV